MTARTWDGKRYHSLKYFLKQKFGEKVYKISIDAGFSCPNRNGTIDTRGCIFCSPQGSGEFAGCRSNNIVQQMTEGTKGTYVLAGKHGIRKYIAYFQAFTNTYADIDELRKKYYEALSVPGVIGIAIATRPDCLGDDVLNLLNELSKETYVWVELGLQTVHEKTSELIRRGYPLSCFDEAVNNLNAFGIDVVCHLIFGLPFENKDDMLSSVKYIANKNIQGVKLHLLHILKGTDLADLYRRCEFAVLTKEEYLEIAVNALDLLPPHMVIHRLTGDGPKETLLAPMWSKNKRDVLNGIERELILRDSWQGKYWGQKC